jgi:cell division protease FtsH
MAQLRAPQGEKPGPFKLPRFASWVWYLAAAVLLALLLLQVLTASSTLENLGYSDFKRLLAANQLQEVILHDASIEGSVRAAGLERVLSADALRVLKGQAASGQAAYPFVTQRAEDPQLIPQLDSAQASYRVVHDSHTFNTMLEWILGAGLFVGLWGLAIRGGGGGGAIGSLADTRRSHAKLFIEKDTGVHFSDVEGIDEAKEELVEVVRFLKDPERYRRLGGHMPKGVLIVGAPGTGKTLLAKAVAGEAGVPFLSISGSEFVEMFVGVGAARVRDLFKQAEELAPCIVFVDELDALGKARGIGGPISNDEREQTLNQLLVALDGFDSNSGVIVLAATNRPEILDPALLRPGRFDRHIGIDRPDIRGREKILRLHAKQLVLAPEVELGSLAARTPGFAGADLANLVNEAALHAARCDKRAVDMADFDAALERILGGLEKRNRVMNAREKEIVAYHEAGHALIAELRPQADRVNKISIIPRGIGTLGFTQQRPTEDRYLLRRSELLDRLDVLLGGRVAEHLIYGDVSTGAQDDLRKASDMAMLMVTEYGMSERLGEVSFSNEHSLLEEGAATPRRRPACSENTALVIDQEVALLLSEAHRRDLQTLREQRATLEKLARYLLAHEVIERAKLDELLGRAQSPASDHPLMRVG